MQKIKKPISLFNRDFARCDEYSFVISTSASCLYSCHMREYSNSPVATRVAES